MLALLTRRGGGRDRRVTIAYNSGPADDAEFGSADTCCGFDGDRPTQRSKRASTRPGSGSGRPRSIGHRSRRRSRHRRHGRVPRPGPARPVRGPAARAPPRRYPAGRRQVAVTDGVADLLRLEIGRRWPSTAGRGPSSASSRTHGDLSDEFALVSPAVRRRAGHRHGSGRRRCRLDRRLPGRPASPLGQVRPPGATTGRPVPLAMFSVATVFLLLASLVAAAGFAVIAQRRLRQLGMLAAIGATAQHLRLVLLTNGAHRRRDRGGRRHGRRLRGLARGPRRRSRPASTTASTRSACPGRCLRLVVLVAFIGATAAAWWPGRAVARVPVTLALSARPPRPKPAHRSAILAAAADRGRHRQPRARRPDQQAAHRRRAPGDDPRHPAPRPVGDPQPSRGRPSHVPIAPRLALRDLGRYQARSGAALAAITLALGITAAVVVIAAAEEKRDDERMAAEPPNLSDRQIRVYTGRIQEPQLIPLPIQTPDQLAAECRARRVDSPQLSCRRTVIPRWKPIATRQSTPGHVRGHPGPRRRRSREEGESPKNFNLASGLYVATPRLAPAPRYRPRHGRSERGLPGRPDRPGRRALILSYPGPAAMLAVTNVQRIDSRQVLGAGSRAPACRPRS